MNKLYPLCFLLFSLNVTHLKANPEVPDCEVLRYYTYCDVRDGKLTRTDTMAIQINSRSGEDYCKIEIPFSKGNPITHFAAWIEDTNGIVVRQLKRQEYVDISSIADYSLYEDDYIRKFTLKHNRYPYRIFYTYRIVFRQFLNIADWYPVLDSDIPTHHAMLVFDYPENYRFNVYEKNITSPEINESANGITRYWHATYDGKISSEIFSPYIISLLPTVKIIPETFQYGLQGSTIDWRSYGKWQSDLIRGIRNLSETDKLKISAMLGQTKDKKEIVRILYHYLQDNTRYINVTLDIGGLKPYPAEYVAINKYGDCKALTNYMMAMLEYVGIHSFYTPIHANRQPKEILKEIPAQQFNHVILAVPVDNDTIWLENTNNSNPFGYIGTFIQNRTALLVDDSNSRLTRIPALQKEDVKNSRKIELNIDSIGNATVSLFYNFRGINFELYNSLYTQYNQDDQNNFIHNNIPFSEFEMLDWKLSKKNRDAREITLASSVTVKQILKTIGKDSYFPLIPVEMPDFTSPRNRKLPLELPYPINLCDTIIYHLSPGNENITLPANSKLDTKYGSYVVDFIQQSNCVSVIRELMLQPGYISLAEYGDFYNFIAAIKSEDKRKIIIQSK